MRGSPICVRCPNCKQPQKSSRTGDVREKVSRRFGKKSGCPDRTDQVELVCLCGYSWWSSHPDAKTRPVCFKVCSQCEIEIEVQGK